MAEQSGDTETPGCDFCGKRHNEVVRANEVVKLIVGVNVDLDGTVTKGCICNGCLATLMIVMAQENRELFDKAVEEARSFKPEEPAAD